MSDLPSTRSRLPEPVALAISLGAVALIVAVYVQGFGIRHPTIAALSFLLIVFIAAARSTLRVAIATSLVSVVCFNFFFLPPYGTLGIEDPENWFALFTLLFVSVVVSRLSARARQREEAEIIRRGDELRSAVLASLSHDLRTPLTALRVASNNLQSADLSDAQKNEQIDLIRSEVDRLNHLFANIMEMARIDTHAVTAELDWVPPSEIIDTARRQVGPELERHPIRVDVDERIVARVDPRLTSAAVAHLLENAAQYSPAGAPIDVRVWHDNGEMKIEVRDHGSGLAPGDVDRVFDRFYRGSSGSSRFGTGMGLAITRGLLAAERGRVWADSTPGSGARFTVAIPADVRTVADQGDGA